MNVVQPKDKTLKLEVVQCKFSSFHESDSEQIKNQIDVHLFFWWVFYKEFVLPEQTIDQVFYW